MTAKILLIEDDFDTNQLLTRYLQKSSFEVHRSYDGEESSLYLDSVSYDLVIVDIMLPNISGFDLIKKIRLNKYTPVIIISAKNTSQDKVRGLGLGADDYITKPFNMNEFLARVKAQLRRFQKYNQQTDSITENLYHAGIHLDLNAYELHIHGEIKQLREKEFQILKLLMSHPNRVFTKEYLYETIWGEPYLKSDENKIMVHIRMLREKVETDPSSPQLIQTIWGIGYKLGEGDK
ncbi:response regulator transcription factor [Oceanobacillus jeddahense]|uniref:Response regulator transcription factor n=1 Tax=Oceanobacillus jeddahense TaxID=1462527 RepID=A0ABY5JXJ4_9BACI|nr:response regulator transcription factor [Oceanobacillus jeddahense]UUI04965.1 response regulator transcription factor [Oceanobacillus jeddahense]